MGARPLIAQQKVWSQDGYIYNIRKTTEAIKIDGELSENIWQETLIASDFWMSYPVDDRKAYPATQRKDQCVK